ncbi:MAG TPA: hypothetical protein VE057_20515 [Archangium sp.]|nr:hypothetical protein [Archangium sp.]
MKWRMMVLGICVVLLLLPLALLLASVLRPEPRQGARFIPMLDGAERMRLETYGRACMRSSECEAPLRCLRDLRSWRSFCADSQCMSDSHCEDRRVCRGVAASEDGSLMRLCVLLGTREEGERCEQLPSRADEACGPGLLCGGREGWCGRPCRLDAAKDCPESFFCADAVPEPLCLPTCEARGCPTGQQCIRFAEGVSACMEVYGSNCQDSGCPESQTCKVLDGITAPGKVWMACVRECGKGLPACPEGRFCFTATCELPCEPHEPTSCGAGFRCVKHHPARPGRCWPEWSPAP